MTTRYAICCLLHAPTDNIEQDDSSYARPTVVSSSSRPPPHSSSAASVAFTTLSTVAMDELHALERQEALRRADYEARHAEVLRKAEFESRRLSHPTYPYHDARKDNALGLSHAHRSKSATTSPTSTPYLYPEPSMSAGYFGLSSQRGEEYRYHRQEESPITSDDEHDHHYLIRTRRRHSTTKHSPTIDISSYTPSTSPFLGPLRTLNLHSTNPSRAPSPILLPPASLDHHSFPRSRKSSSGAHNPYPIHYHPRDTSHNVSHHHPHLSVSDRMLPPLSTSNESSRASSPVLSSISPSSSISFKDSFAREPRAGSQHHEKLRKEVRLAFGMTPIHPQPPPARNSSWPTFNNMSHATPAVHTYTAYSSYPASGSTSTTRSTTTSPLIKLAPLMMMDDTGVTEVHMESANHATESDALSSHKPESLSTSPKESKQLHHATHQHHHVELPGFGTLFQREVPA